MILTRIPPVIRRNMWLIAGAQVSAGAASQLIPSLGALMAVQLSGSTGLAGAASSMLGLGRLLIAYPVGVISDRFGRKSGLFLGLALSLLGSLLIGLSMLVTDLGLFFLGVLVFAFGAGAVSQLRVAATDMYPASRRAEGLGFLFTASLAGAFVGFGLVSLSELYGDIAPIEPIALTWFLTPVVFLPAFLFVAFVRPDPLQISAHLDRYYAGYREPRHRPEALPAERSGFRVFLGDYPTLVAFVSYFAVQGNMSMMMAVTALVLHSHGHDLTAISLAVAIHTVGMFAPSMALGTLSDRVGRRWVMLFGVLTAAAGSVAVVTTPSYWLITAGLFLVGLGWSAVNVAAIALIADRTSPYERGRAIGANDTFGGAASIALPLAAGPIAAGLGLAAVGIFAMALVVVPTLLLLRLQEPAPGRFGGPVLLRTLP
jgi:MFS family permease